MRFTYTLCLATAATAFVLPDGNLYPQAPLNGPPSYQDEGPPSSWHKELSALKKNIANIFSDAADSLSTTFDSALDSAESTFGEVSSELDSIFHDDDQTYVDVLGPDSSLASTTTDRDYSSYTIYDIITHSKSTTKFAKLVEGFPDIVSKLKSTKANYTLFVPLNSAFEKIPNRAPKPGEKGLKRVIEYHLGLGAYHAKRSLKTHTIPTALKEAELGEKPQRIRVSVSLRAVKLNFYSKIVAPDFTAKNGVIHAIDTLLIPPPPTDKSLTMLPGSFSTLLLAVELTDFFDFVSEAKPKGATVFAPTNKAFNKLGRPALGFLFDSKPGHKYLLALLKYHVALSQTLYTDAFYDGVKGKDFEAECCDDEAEAEGVHTEHYELKSALQGAPIGVDVGSWAGFVSVKVNGFAKVGVTNVVAKNGVAHALHRVLVPPKKYRRDGVVDSADNISVEELKERLDPYLE